jgi:transposase
MPRYSTDLTDSQWETIKPLFDLQRKRKYDLRTVITPGPGVDSRRFLLTGAIKAMIKMAAFRVLIRRL